MSERLPDDMIDDTVALHTSVYRKNEADIKAPRDNLIRRMVEPALKLFSGVSATKEQTPDIITPHEQQEPSTHNTNGTKLTLEEYIGPERVRAMQEGKLYAVRFGTRNTEESEEFIARLIDVLKKIPENQNHE